METPTALLWIVALGALGVAAFSVWRRTIVRVEAGEIGLVLRRGALTDRVVDPGEHTLIPFVESIVKYPARELTYMVVEEELIPTLQED